MKTLNDLTTDFNAIHNEEGIDALVKSFGLIEADPKQFRHVRNLVVAYEGEVCGTMIVLTHRWHDPSQAFSIQPDINKLELRIGDRAALLNEYPDSF